MMCAMERPPVGMDELVEHWTVLRGERNLIEAKHSATRTGLTQYHQLAGRQPRQHIHQVTACPRPGHRGWPPRVSAGGGEGHPASLPASLTSESQAPESWSMCLSSLSGSPSVSSIGTKPPSPRGSMS